MFLYLVQHAEAKGKQEDPFRGLTKKGLDDIKKTAQHVSSLEIKPDQIFHSGKKRAKQTAQILNWDLHSNKGISETTGLDPLDAPRIWAERMLTVKEDIMLVGHLPHLGRFASLLVYGEEDKKVVDFRMGAIVCLKRDEDMAWSLEWISLPSQL